MRSVNIISLALVMSFSLNSYGACSGGSTSTTRTETRPTGNTVRYQDSTPSDSIISITTIDQSDFNLKLTFVTWSKYDYYDAPEVKNVRIVTYEAKPGTTLAGNAILLGLPLLFNPKRQIEGLLGCTDEYESTPEPDKTKRIITSDYEWKVSKSEQCFVYVDISDSKSFSKSTKVKCNSNETQLISLKEEVINSIIEDAGSINVSCSECKLLIPNGATINQRVKGQDNLSVKVDFSDIKISELQRIKQAEIDRIEAENAAKKIAEQEIAIQEQERRKELARKELERKLAKEKADKELEREKERIRQQSIKEHLMNL